MGLFSNDGFIKDALLGCGIALIVISFPFACIGGCLYHSWQNFPERAKKDAIVERYADHISVLDRALSEPSSSALKLASKLEDLPHPNDMVFLALEMDGPDPGPGEDPPRIVILDRATGKGGSSHSMFSDAGYGSWKGQKVLMLRMDVPDLKEVDHLIVYWEDPGPPPSGNTSPSP